MLSSRNMQHKASPKSKYLFQVFLVVFKAEIDVSLHSAKFDGCPIIRSAKNLKIIWFQFILSQISDASVCYYH